MRNSTQRPAAYLKDLPPAYELKLEVGFALTPCAAVAASCALPSCIESQVSISPSTRRSHDVVQGHPVLQTELERVQEGKPMEALDVTRYRLDKPPLTRRNDFAAWKKALENAHSQLGHQYNRCGVSCNKTATCGLRSEC